MVHRLGRPASQSSRRQPVGCRERQRPLSDAARGARIEADIDVETSKAFRELIAYMDGLARELELHVKTGKTGSNYQPRVREPGVTYASGIGVYSSGRGVEFNLRPFRDMGHNSVADDLLRRIREVTG